MRVFNLGGNLRNKRNRSYWMKAGNCGIGGVLFHTLYHRDPSCVPCYWTSALIHWGKSLESLVLDAINMLMTPNPNHLRKWIPNVPGSQHFHSLFFLTEPALDLMKSGRGAQISWDFTRSRMAVPRGIGRRGYWGHPTLSLWVCHNTLRRNAHLGNPWSNPRKAVQAL